MGVVLGIECLLAELPSWFRRARVGILCNQASVDAKYRFVVDACLDHGIHVTSIFSPQHGLFLDKQANMVEADDVFDEKRRIPIHSLYGESKWPKSGMFHDIDVLLVDLQDVGTRVYTYATIVGLCLEATSGWVGRVVIVDRPNPMGGQVVEGNPVKCDYRSLVGRYFFPMRHGMTLGEIARYIVNEKGLDCDLRVVPMRGWARTMFYPCTGLPWCFPSPNMPRWETTMVYPATVLLEGTNLSEGRGTTLPFEIFGAPFLDHDAVLSHMDPTTLRGIHLRPIAFEPTFDKWQGCRCWGFQIHLLDAKAFQPYRFGLDLLRALLMAHGDRFEWLDPPYEYERGLLPIDILLGDGRIRRALEQGRYVREIESMWVEDLRKYRERRRSVLMDAYERDTDSAGESVRG